MEDKDGATVLRGWDYTLEDDGGISRITEESGISRKFFIDAPERSLSLRPEEAQPYSTVDARMEADGFYTFFVRILYSFAKLLDGVIIRRSTHSEYFTRNIYCVCSVKDCRLHFFKISCR